MHEIGRFVTVPEVCGYLHDRPSRTECRYLIDLSSSEYGELLAEGWRRFGFAVFRPSCGACTECVPIRVRVEEFRPSKSQRRVLRRNRDVFLEIGEPLVDGERLELYRRHHGEREAARGWKPSQMDLEAYAQSFVLNATQTLEFRYRVGSELVAVAYVGEADEALNSIYAFYDPRFARRGLGTLDVLQEIEEARRRDKRFLYLGYYVAGCGSMTYKASFAPCEMLRGGQWVGRAPTDGAAAE